MNIFKNLAITVLMIIFLMILSIKVEATTGKINSETVNLREEANTTSAILEQLDIGEEVEVLEQADGWYKVIATVEGKKITGYISESLLDVEENISENEEQISEEKEPTEEQNNSEPSNSEAVEETNTVEEQTIKNALKVEENNSYELNQSIKIKILPLINSIDKESINSGKINIVEIINDWCKVENETQVGWIRINTLKNAIANVQETPIDTTETNNNIASEIEETDKEENVEVIKTLYVNANSLKVRKEPNTSSDVIDSLTRNAQVSIIEELDGWYKIKIGNQTGYVSATYISEEKTEETTSRGNVNRQEETNSTVETSNSETVATGTSGEAVVEYAKQFLGYKYVSGGASPSTGFDCSGFTSYVYKQFGVSLYRTSRDQIKNGVAVEKSNLQPGDIVVFNNDANTSIGHVGIYIGSGNFIHAANPSDGVKITSLSSSYYATRYVGARRVI